MTGASVSQPYPDPKTARNRTPDYLVAVKRGVKVEVERFSSEDEAQVFSDSSQEKA